VDITFFVLDVTKHNCLRWTCVLASRFDFVRTDFPVAFGLGFDLGVLDSLHTVGALFHNPATADCHFRIHHHALKLKICFFQAIRSRDFDKGLGIRVIEVIKPANLEWAVVTAIASPDTAVVDHVIEAFIRVHRCGNWTNGFARSFFTLLTCQRLVCDGGVDAFAISLLCDEVTVDPHPLHLATFTDLLLADDRNVIFGLAGNHAGVATGALV